MSSSTLLLYAPLETADPSGGPSAFALSAAALLHAHLNVLALHVDISAPPSWNSRTIEETEQASASRRQESVVLAEAIVSQAHEQGIAVSSQTDWSHSFGLIPFIGDQAKLHDFTFCGLDQSIFLNERKVAEHVLFESGRPVVMVPAGYKAPFTCNRIVVAWDNSRSAARALHDALPFLRQAKEVVLVAVGGEKRFQTSPDPETIQTAMARKGLNARFVQIELGDRKIGRALQGFALESAADLLVMGAYGHSRFREFILGGATREVLETLEMPVLMSL